MKRHIFTLAFMGLTAACMAQQAPMKLWYSEPASYFEQSLPIGNGKLGATIYGGADDNLIYLNDITLWSGKPVDRNEDAGASKWLKPIREALFAEDYALADSLQVHLQGHDAAYYMPLATIHIYDLNRGQTSDYQRKLSLDSAVCYDTYKRGGVTYRREYFASHPDKVIAIRLSASELQKINVRVTLGAQTEHQVSGSGSRLTLTGHATGDERETTHYCSILKADTKGGRLSASGDAIVIENADEATLYFVNETSFNGFDKHPVREGADYITNAETDLHALQGRSFSDLKERHITDYSNLFGRFTLRLGKEDANANSLPTDIQLKNYTQNGGGNLYLETLYMQFGRYLLISCSRTKGVPANLQGLWNHKLKAPWRSDYTVNINLEENYWPAETANLGELTMPLFTLMGNLAENGKYTALNYYGINRGWCSSHNSDCWALTNPVGAKEGTPMWANWNLGFAWLSFELWEHYAYTKDLSFLRNTAYPLMKGAAEFCADWLVDNPKKPGELITAPSTSPENRFLLDGKKLCTSYGGTADLAIIRELFTNTLQATSILGINDTLTSELNDKLKRLHPYTIGSKGTLNEWYYDWTSTDIHHRHVSHLIGLYPGHQITVDGTPDLAKASEATLNERGDVSTGWSTGWKINLWARLGDGNHAYKIYRNLLRYVPVGNQKTNYGGGGGTYPNLFDAHPPFQIDGNFGGTAGVCEMLLQSSMDRITLLPAIPNEWSEGSVHGICARGGFIIDMDWADGKVTKATITSREGGTTTVRYNGKERKIRLKAGRKVTLK